MDPRILELVQEFLGTLRQSVDPTTPGFFDRGVPGLIKSVVQDVQRNPLRNAPIAGGATDIAAGNQAIQEGDFLKGGALTLLGGADLLPGVGVLKRLGRGALRSTAPVLRRAVPKHLRDAVSRLRKGPDVDDFDDLLRDIQRSNQGLLPTLRAGESIPETLPVGIQSRAVKLFDDSVVPFTELSEVKRGLTRNPEFGFIDTEGQFLKQADGLETIREQGGFIRPDDPRLLRVQNSEAADKFFSLLGGQPATLPPRR